MTEALLERARKWLEVTEALQSFADAVRPLEEIVPSAWAARYRHVDGGPFPGQWLNDNAPYLVGWMDSVKECMDRDKKGVVGMKCAQAAGTEAMGVNAIGWLITYYPGPYLYLTAIDETAEELSRDRWVHVLNTCAPLKKKHLRGKSHGEKILVKRFTDAKLVLSGSKSPNKYISNPYRGYVLDEHDSVMETLPDGADPLATLDKRRAAWGETGKTIGITLAHPTTIDRGAGKLWYNESDQRRCHVVCPHCEQWIAPSWSHIKASARAGQSAAQAERDPSCYAFACPGTTERACGAIWSDSDRLSAIRVVEQRSTLPPEVAATKAWIGVHFWAFFLRSGGSVHNLAAEYVAAIDEPGKMRAFFNKTLGDVYEDKDQDVTLEAWQDLIPEEGSPGAYRVGTVPPEVQWLTAGQDSRLDELHWAVWGWGYVRSESSAPLLCGWLVDAGVLAGPRRIDKNRSTVDASDLFVFDQVLYSRTWDRVGGGLAVPVWQALHDSGMWHTAVYEYCRTKKGRGFPSRGGNDDDRSKAPACKWSDPPAWIIGTEKVTDPELRRADLNTYRLKCDLAGDVEKRFADSKGAKRSRLALPHDAGAIVDEQGVSLLAHLSSERLIREKGRRRWTRRGPNHWWDCLVMARAAALNVAAAIENEAAQNGTAVRTREEEILEAQAANVKREQPSLPSAPTMREQARRARRSDSHGINTDY